MYSWLVLFDIRFFKYQNNPPPIILLFSNFFHSECQFAVLAVLLTDRPTTPPILTATVPTAEVLAISGHMVPEDHQHTIRPTSYVLRLILLSLVLRLTEVELLVRFVTNKCSPTSPWSTRFVYILTIFWQKSNPFAIGVGNFNWYNLTNADVIFWLSTSLPLGKWSKIETISTITKT